MIINHIRCKFIGQLHWLLLIWVIPATATTAGGNGLETGLEAYAEQDYEAAYRAFLPLAKDGDPELQNLVGYMLYYGKGVAAAAARAHYWFHEAAEQGQFEAQLNLGVLHTVGAEGVEQDYREAESWFNGLPPQQFLDRELDSTTEEESARVRILKQLQPVLKIDAEVEHRGKDTFLKFCAGCHGFDGFAAHPAAPSFSMGDRLNKDDQELLYSLLNGKYAMPAWKGKLPETALMDVIRYLRTMHLLTRYETLTRPAEIPEYFFYFNDGLGNQVILETKP